MSENEINPVARFAVKTDGNFRYEGMECHKYGAYVEYSDHKAAIDRLTEDLCKERAQNDRFMDKWEEFRKRKNSEFWEIVAERDAAVADAERYRWLRDPNNYPDTDDVDSFWYDILGECCDGQSFDYEIDSAMKEQEQGK